MEAPRLQSCAHIVIRHADACSLRRRMLFFTTAPVGSSSRSLRAAMELAARADRSERAAAPTRHCAFYRRYPCCLADQGSPSSLSHVGEAAVARSSAVAAKRRSSLYINWVKFNVFTVMKQAACLAKKPRADLNRDRWIQNPEC